MGREMTREEAIRAVTERLVEHFRPESVYLFGSSARGDAGLESDLDFCVVLPDDAPSAAMRPGGLYERLWDVPLSVDVFRMRRTEFEKRRGWQASIPAAVTREGRLLYARNPG
jgi:predicted nucleotidyltransferase